MRTVLITLTLTLALTQANGLIRPFIPDAPIPTLTTYHGHTADGLDTDSGVVFAVPSLICVGVETVGDPGPFLWIGDDC